ncbi:hypothetical protein HGRIS_007759 [Hohenbuehelia grisea]|uniref:FMN hydroxy acid dehydrogenase domain-containing protein n=1 Tax=Hohenbuehelia grisea TaxID=104357 RepID=A0ABR3J5W4_9AGAR
MPLIFGTLYRSHVRVALQEHPGGARIILRYAGQDATTAYEPIHPPDALQKNLPSEKHLGPLREDAAATLSLELQNRKKASDEVRVEKALAQRPPLKRILSLNDMEDVAKSVLSYKAWAYYSSASDDEITNLENARAFSRFFFQARVMRPVSHCDPSTTILGYKTSIPVFVSGAALAKLGHPDGEANITRGTAPLDVIQMVSSNASLSYEEIASAASPGQVLFFQFYKHKNDKIAEERVREVEKLEYKALWLTVDAVVAGNRERDIKSPWILEDMEKPGGGDAPRSVEDIEQEEEEASFGTAGALVANDDQDMTWERVHSFICSDGENKLIVVHQTIPWIRSITKLPIVVKGVQCVQDAVLAAEAGVDGILLSNHGGRQLEYSLPPLEILYQLRQKRPDVFDRTEVYIDGGIKRGTDILKAVCLGARAVGIGRPFLYAQSAYGAKGVTKIIKILEREIITGMRLLGASTTGDLRPELVERVDWQPTLRTRL